MDAKLARVLVAKRGVTSVGSGERLFSLVSISICDLSSSSGVEIMRAFSLPELAPETALPLSLRSVLPIGIGDLLLPFRVSSAFQWPLVPMVGSDPNFVRSQDCAASPGSCSPWLVGGGQVKRRERIRYTSFCTSSSSSKPKSSEKVLVPDIIFSNAMPPIATSGCSLLKTWLKSRTLLMGPASALLGSEICRLGLAAAGVLSAPVGSELRRCIVSEGVLVLTCTEPSRLLCRTMTHSFSSSASVLSVMASISGSVPLLSKLTPKTLSRVCCFSSEI
mmetsp:Transcript_74633/g.192593  ORF Transcript_74633/g.192593 Transcript_74633/m.192593 type:complete len:277 (-) Transcript_74633:1893-2723(-)